MINVLQKLEPYFDIEEIKTKFPDVDNVLELAVLVLRSNNCSYGQIQSWLGNPSKKWIRSVLLKWAPELIDIKTN